MQTEIHTFVNLRNKTLQWNLLWISLIV
uniref:Uncharacterized protein n=1 Tax=Anguilla anguilla TaxID=7936 RepID=A0A0E9XP56_ANGAN